jgi:hypothetical protein
VLGVQQRRGGQQPRLVRLPGEPDGFVDGAGRGGIGPGLGQCLGQVEQQRGAAGRGGPRRLALHVQGVPEMTGSLLPGQRAQRILAGQPGVVHGPGGGFGAGGGGPQEVVGQLGVASPGAVLQVFQHRGDPVVCPGPGLRRQLGVEGFPDQRVPEPVDLADLLAGAEQPDGGGVVAQPGDRSGRGAQRRRDQGRVDARAERGGGGQDFFRGRRAVACSAGAEPGDLAADGLPDARRDRHLLDRGRTRPQQACHLGYEQWVALAAALDHGEHVGVRAGQHEPDVPGGQARQDQRRAG